MAQKIDEELQLFICRRLAEFAKATDIVTVLRDKGVEITPQNIYKNYQHAEKWSPVIVEMRQAYLNSYLEIPIARRVERFRMLQKLFDEARQENLYNPALNALRLAQTECNQMQGDEVGPIVMSDSLADLTDEEIEAKIDQLLKNPQ
jgi:hypothetical protein